MNEVPAVKQFMQELTQQSQELASVLPAGLDIKRFQRTVSNTLATHPQAERLLAANRQSLFIACQKAAGDGLLVDGREATLVVFHDRKTDQDNVTYLPMVQGLVKLARNSGEIANLYAEVVFEKDEFEYEPGAHLWPHHKPDWFGDRGQPVGAYAVVTTQDGEKIVRILKKDRILAIGRGGHNADQYIPGKGAHFEEWWRKTAIKNVLKYAPKSSELQSAIDADNAMIDPDRIPPVETVDEPDNSLRARLQAQGETVTARKESSSPSARSAASRPEGQELTSTETTGKEDKQETTQKTGDSSTNRTERLRDKLQKQMPLPEVTEQDRQTLQVAIDSLNSCNSLAQLEQFGRDLQDQLHPALKEEAIEVYRAKKAALEQGR